MRRPEVESFISIAPPTNLHDFSFLAPCPSDGLIIHGDHDKVVPMKDTQALIDKLATQKGIVIDHAVLPGANHFFEDHMDELIDNCTNYVDSQLGLVERIEMLPPPPIPPLEGFDDEMG